MKRKSMDTKKFKIVFDKIYDLAADLLDKEENLYEVCQIASLELLHLIYCATTTLRDFQAEDPAEKEINWYNNPLVSMDIPVKMDWERLMSISEIWIDHKGAHSRMTLQDLVNMAETLESSFSKEKGLFIFKILCRDIASIGRGVDFVNFSLPKYFLMTRPKDLSQKEWEKAAVDKLKEIKSLTFSLYELMTDDMPEKDRINCSLIVKAYPLIIDFHKMEAYSRVCVGVDFKGVEPARWSKEKRREFWDILLRRIEALIPEGMLELFEI